MTDKAAKVLKVAILVLIVLALVASVVAKVSASGGPVALGDGVYLEPGEEVIIYCAGPAPEVENIDDRTGVARCAPDKAVFSPAVVSDD